MMAKKRQEDIEKWVVSLIQEEHGPVGRPGP